MARSKDNWREWPLENKKTLLAALRAKRGQGTKLHPRQVQAMNLDAEEGLYGGAAGGGKTEWGLEWLAEKVGIPKYSGLFLRRTFAQLSKSADSPIYRAFDIFGPRGGTWHSSDKKWTFANGAVVEFGHMQHETSVMEYQGPSYHRIFYDELTQFSENQYTYLFSRMRRHEDFPIDPQIRAASNPGGPGEPGHVWVRRRFVTKEAEDAIKALSHDEPSPEGMIFWPTPGRFFLPARLADNPTLDVKDYSDRMLRHLPVALRRRLLNGDWTAVEGALVMAEWLARYRTRGDILIPMDLNGNELGGCAIDRRMVQRYAVVDTAGTSKQKAAESRGKPPSFSCCKIFEYDTIRDHLYLVHVWHDRVGWGDLVRAIQETVTDWECSTTIVENAHFGPALAEELTGTNVVLVNPVIEGMKSKSLGGGMGAKLERAVASGFLRRLEDGKFFTPDTSSEGAVTWLADWEDELLSWTGLEDEMADQIDCASYGCNHVRQPGGKRSWGGAVSGSRPNRRGRISMFGG